jgi:peroxiredoxin
MWIMQSSKHVVAVGDQLPDISLTATDGRIIRLRDYRGKRLFIFMWASW